MSLARLYKKSGDMGRARSYVLKWAENDMKLRQIPKTEDRIQGWLDSM